MAVCSNVLLIDDDELFNLVTEQTLRMFDFADKVVSCLTVDQAFAYLNKALEEENHLFPDLILLDINMPEKDGWEFLTTYRQFPEEIKKKGQLYMLSSSVHESDILKSQQFEDVRDFIRKPLSKRDLDIIKFRLEGPK